MVKTAVVTGATGGMGVEIIKDLARDHRVYALGRRAGELPEAEKTALAAQLKDYWK